MVRKVCPKFDLHNAVNRTVMALPTPSLPCKVLWDGDAHGDELAEVCVCEDSSITSGLNFDTEYT